MRLPDTSVWRRALEIALPLMLAESADSILWIVDTYFVSGLGDKALAAVGVGGYLGWLMFVGGSLFYMGALVLVAQYVGARDVNGARRATGEALTSNILLAVPLALAAYWFSPTLVSWLAGPRVDVEVKSMAVSYFHYRLLGLPFTYAALVLDAAYRGVGRTRPVFTATVAFTLVNAVLDPLLIYGMLGLPAMGVAGAGLASSIASAVYLVGLYVQAPRWLGYTPTPLPPGVLAWRAATIGVPALVERLAFVGGNLVYLGSVARCGEDALAAHTIGVRIESLAFLPIFAIGESAATLAGQAVGAGSVGEARRSGWEVAKLDMLAGVIAGIVIALLAPHLPWAFTDNPRVARLARDYLLIAAATEPFFGAAISLTMAIRGAGNTTVPTVINLSSLYLLRVLPATVIPRMLPPGLCVYGAWSAMAIDMGGRAAISTTVYRRWFERLARRVV